MKTMKKNNVIITRIWYLEYLRILATVAVIVLHVASQSFYAVGVTSFEWKVFNAADGMVRWCVPLFLMISGALFLDNSRPLPMEKLYKKYILRIVTAFLFWSALYAVVGYFQGVTLKKTVMAFVQGPSHMWYIFMIVGLYVITPFLRKITESEKLTEYFLVLTLVMTVALPRITSLIRVFKLPHADVLLECYNAILSDTAFHFTLGYVGYFVAGYYLSKKDLSKFCRRFCYVLGVAGIAGTVLLTDWYSNKIGSASVFFYAHFGFCTVCATIGLFVFGKYVLASFVPKGRMATFISATSKYSFGIYMVHMLVLNTIRKFGITTLSGNPVVAVIGLVVATLVISYGISALLHQIPGLKKYVV